MMAGAVKLSSSVLFNECFFFLVRSFPDDFFFFHIIIVFYLNRRTWSWRKWKQKTTLKKKKKASLPRIVSSTSFIIVTIAQLVDEAEYKSMPLFSKMQRTEKAKACLICLFFFFSCTALSSCCCNYWSFSLSFFFLLFCRIPESIFFFCAL